MEMLGYQFWVYLVVTSLRHIGFLSYELHHARTIQTRPLVVTGSRHLALFRTLYIVMWVGAGYSLAQRPTGSWFAWGLGIFVAGSVIRLVGLRTLGRFYSSYNVIRPDHELVRHGIYGVIRHPLLLGLILELLGIATMSNQTWLWIGWITSTIVLLWWQQREDALLRRHFGPVAENYQTEVPAVNFLTGLWRKLQSP